VRVSAERATASLCRHRDDELGDVVRDVAVTMVFVGK
jgi:hypothetical protein